MNENKLRLSGLLWSLDPKGIADRDDLFTDHYDDLASELLDAFQGWIAGTIDIDKCIDEFFMDRDIPMSLAGAEQICSFLGLQ